MIYAALAGLVALLGGLFAAFRAGKSSQAAKQLQADAKAHEIAHEIEGDIGAMPPVVVKEELRRWSKD